MVYCPFVDVSFRGCMFYVLLPQKNSPKFGWCSGGLKQKWAEKYPNQIISVKLPYPPEV